MNNLLAFSHKNRRKVYKGEAQLQYAHVILLNQKICVLCNNDPDAREESNNTLYTSQECTHIWLQPRSKILLIEKIFLHKTATPTPSTPEAIAGRDHSMEGQERHHSIDEGVYYIVEIRAWWHFKI